MKITRGNVGDLFVGQRVMVFFPNDRLDALLTTFVRTNRVRSNNQDFLYITVQQEDGKERAFNIDNVRAYGEVYE